MGMSNIQFIGLYTIIRREFLRMMRIASQVFLPPVITTTLYFIIFGRMIGPRIGSINGISYPEFIAPGLIMMTVIINSYSNVSTSLFSVRFQKNIEEILVSPLHNGLILLGYVSGGILRGVIVSILVYLIAWFFIGLEMNHLPITLLVVILVATTFSLAGFTNAMIARNFDDVALIPTFVLTPLTYLGGVFYANSMLPPFWQKISALNPILYMVNAFRHAILGKGDVNMPVAIGVTVFLVVAFTLLNLVLLKKGIGLRD